MDGLELTDDRRRQIRLCLLVINRGTYHGHAPGDSDPVGERDIELLWRRRRAE